MNNEEAKTATLGEALTGLAFAMSAAAGITAVTVFAAGVGVTILLLCSESGPTPIRPFKEPEMDLADVTRVRVGGYVDGPYAVELKGEDAVAIAALIARRTKADDRSRGRDARRVAFRIDGEWDAYITGWLEPDRRRILFEEVEGNGFLPEPLGYTTVDYEADEIPSRAARLFDVEKASTVR